MYLLDTNIVSEMRKANTSQRSAQFVKWLESINLDLCYLSTMSWFEVEMGILRKERQDVAQGKILRHWFENVLKPEFSQRLIPVSPMVALQTAKLHVPNPAAMIDSFIAATAIEQGKILVTRNIKDFAHFNVKIINPFEPQ
ncbi:type II toxin-antitoxin system VapC family toxin [Caviibacterium pharyngocola]|uniref:VapC toxin family PIN domain ribonuclease n=1 Tax=Caviibacterium pharyngocola TaxID=28159 RepID=A0A2M8RU00_9PAST|nr:type II toxin-antitoxin system VapC family toxin [Caviibacterium pharyngocola]PJG82363.1 VapC toxin family PIN domain ribonuclease [Caviibacterium pharyngocola]